MIEALKRTIARWFFRYRDEDTGRFISKAQAEKMNPRDVMTHRVERKRKDG